MGNPAQLSSEQDIKASEVAFFGQVSIDLVNNLWNNVHDIYWPCLKSLGNTPPLQPVCDWCKNGFYSVRFINISGGVC